MKYAKYNIGIISFVALIFILSSCNNEIKFDQAKWREHPDLAFTPPYRKKMLKDLITINKLKGVKYSEIINLLGTPNFDDSTSFGYDIIIEYGSDIDPVYTKTLDFTFSKDSIITSFKVNEWKK